MNNYLFYNLYTREKGSLEITEKFQKSIQYLFSRLAFDKISLMLQRTLKPQSSYPLKSNNLFYYIPLSHTAFSLAQRLECSPMARSYQRL